MEAVFITAWNQALNLIKTSFWLWLLIFPILQLIITIITDTRSLVFAVARRYTLKKYSDREESNLWQATRDFIVGNISTVDLESIKQRNTQNIKESVIELAQDAS